MEDSVCAALFFGGFSLGVGISFLWRHIEKERD